MSGHVRDDAGRCPPMYQAAVLPSTAWKGACGDTEFSPSRRHFPPRVGSWSVLCAPRAVACTNVVLDGGSSESASGRRLYSVEYNCCPDGMWRSCGPTWGKSGANLGGQNAMWFGGNHGRWKDGNDMAKFQRKGKEGVTIWKRRREVRKGEAVQPQTRHLHHLENPAGF